MDQSEVVRIAVRATLAVVAATLACILALFLLAAAVSPRINVPGIHFSHHAVVSPRSAD